jgi:TetR/AcrR family transcriptional repressor of mexJK operon
MPATKSDGARGSRVPTPTRGRPPDLRKRAKIVAAARRSLVTASAPPGIDSVARRAGVSKLTIYRHFGSFEGLIRAVLDQQHALLMDHADGIPRVVSRDLRRTLVGIGERLLVFLTGDEGLTVLRVTSTPAAHRQRLGRLVYEDGPRRFVARIADLLRSAGPAAGLAIESPLEAAEQLAGSWLGVLVTGLMMNGRARPTRAELRRRARRAVDAFFRAHAR